MTIIRGGVLLLAALVAACGSGNTAKVRSGEDRMEPIAKAMKRDGAIFVPFYEAQDRTAEGSGHLSGTCIEEANQAMEQVLKKKWSVTTLHAEAGAEAPWPKLPAFVQKAKGSRYVIHLEKLSCSPSSAEVTLVVYERDEGKQLIAIDAAEGEKGGTAGVRDASASAAYKLLEAE
jgi:hypothetical protein